MPESLLNITKLYADDTKIISKVSQIENENSLQKDLDTASEWSSNWLIRFNTDKCLIMHYGTNNPETEYELNGLKLKKSDYERELILKQTCVLSPRSGDNTSYHVHQKQIQ